MRFSKVQTMSSPKVERIAPSCILGEGPHWDEKTQKLYYIDIDGAAVLRHDPKTGKNSKVVFGGSTISLIVPVEGKPDTFLISRGKEVHLLHWDGEDKHEGGNVTLRALTSVEKDLHSNRFNDGKVDPWGRLWAGTMPMGEPFEKTSSTPGRGNLYLLNSGDTCTMETKLTSVGIANGLDWSLDRKTMYYIDSILLRVDAFDMDGSNFKPETRRTIFDFKKKNIKGVPDGMTIDTEGKLWVACFNGSQVIRIDPESGELLCSIPIPSLMTTSVAFGGPNMDILYVTSASLEMTDEQRKADPNQGALFKVTGTGCKGFPGRAVKM
ncbi:hypothetical protein J437_LFUL004102 [Ladona fulva]|uniref:Regucalcin n=1 Tax=Ladona fulva TaxID=123851 RepID=A0A8K0JWC8_LADFU|nr:hypothetical protein J437_LFUL004102 [Ladona fulva]